MLAVPIALERKLDECHQELKNVIDNSPWENQEFYKNWLAQCSYLVAHTARLICYAIAHVPIEDRTAYKHWLNHLTEESDHEVLLAKDLNSFKTNFKEFRELPQTSLIYQTQYYWIQKAYPSSVLGYSLLMEGFAAKFGNIYLTRLETEFGLKSSNFLRVHVKEDLQHIETGILYLKSLGNDEIKFVLQNMEQSVFLYTSMIKKIYQNNQSALNKAA